MNNQANEYTPYELGESYPSSSDRKNLNPSNSGYKPPINNNNKPQKKIAYNPYNPSSIIASKIKNNTPGVGVSKNPSVEQLQNQIEKRVKQINSSNSQQQYDLNQSPRNEENNYSKLFK
jgi:hypothetical protein